MQHIRFHNGGYALHKIAGDWAGNVSAWFDRDGNLLECEQIPRSFGPSRPIKRNSPIWRKIVRIGQRYKHIPTE